MSDIKDINHDDIKEFLTLNKIKIFNDQTDYNQAFKLMKNPKAIIGPISIVEWMMAHNVFINKIKLPDYTINELMKLSDNERNVLAKKLGMKSNNINHIINILHYLHKIHTVIGNLKISNNKNIYDIFPKEIWINILLDLNCRDIDSITNKQLNDLVIENDIREKIKFRGFPRTSGHCVAFDVSTFEFTSDTWLITQDELDQTLDFLYDKKSNVVRGDLICFNGLNNYRNDGVWIFDGCEIISLDYDDIDDYGSLPQEFTVINNGVPIRYWENTEKDKGIDNNNVVWFDPEPVRQQCLDNIVDIDDNLFTTFKYNDKTYTIYDHRSFFDDESRNTKDEFFEILLNSELLLLSFTDEFSDLDDENTLYLSHY